MKEHEDCDMVSVEKSSVIVDSTVVEEIVTEKVKIEGSLGERDEEGEDMMVDVVGADCVDLDRKADSVRLVEEWKETESCDLNADTKEEVAGSGEGDVCHVSAGTSILASEKVEVMVNKEGLKTGIEVRDCETAIEPKGEPRFGGGDIDVAEKGSILEQNFDVAEKGSILEQNFDVAEKGSILEQNFDVAEKGSILEQNFDVAEKGSILELEHNVESVEVVKERSQKEIETSDMNMDTEGAAVVTGEDGCRDSVGSEVLAFEKVEVTVIKEGLNTSLEVNKDVLQGNDVTGCGSLVRDSKESSIGGGDNVVIDGKDLTERGSTEEVAEEHVESVKEVADGDRVVDRKSKKEAEVSDSSKIAESLEVDTRVVEDEAEKSVSVDPSLVSATNQNSSTELVNAGMDEVAGKSKEESPHPTMEVTTDGPQGNESVEPRIVGGEKDLIDKEEESDRGLPKEIKEQPMECDQQVADGDRVWGEKIVKESETLDSSMVSEPTTTTNPGSEDVDVVVVEEGLATKNEAQDGVSVDPSLVSADNRSSTIKVVNSATSEGDVIAQTENVDQQAEVITNDAQNLENGTGVGNPELGIDSSSVEPQFERENAVIDIEKTENGLIAEDEEIVEHHSESVQEAIHEDGAMDEKTGKVDEVLDSSNIPESLTRANLVQEEVLTPRIEAQDSDSVGQKLVFPDNQSSPAENSGHRAEVNTTEIATTTNKVIKTEIEDQDFTVYVDDQGLKAGAKLSNEVPTTGEMNGFRVSADPFEEVNGVTDVVNHRVVHEDSGFSYEDGHMERGEDAGMDIDEVLGWKDEIPPVIVDLSGHPEKDHLYDKVNADSEGGNVAGSVVSSPGFKKRKALDSVSDASEKKPSLNPGPTPLFLTPKPSFKVGECIQRVASQLSGPPCDPNGQHVDQLVGPENTQLSVSEMLSQLHSVAQDPMKGYAFVNTIIPFFYDHRAVGRPVSVRKRKTSNENEPEEFEFDDVNDSYWTDRIIQNHPEEQLVQENQNGGQERHVVAYEPDKPAKANRRSNKKRFMFSNHEMGLKEQSELVERRRQNLATEVVLKFPMGIYFPSEIHLNKMFRRFGALMESETEVDRQNGRARVVFKKCCDAEVAHSSAGKFNIFGPINVNYELNYTPLVSYKPLPLSILQQDSMDGS